MGRMKSIHGTGARPSRMPSTMDTATIEAFYEAWSLEGAHGVTSAFEAEGTLEDPLTARPLAGAALVAHVRSFTAAFSRLRFDVERVIGEGEVAAVEWVLRGVCDGAIDREHTAHGVEVTLRGVDILTVIAGRIRAVRRTFDRRALADALGLLTLVEPTASGSMTFGYSLRDWVSKEKPAVLGMTWIQARDEAERERIRGHARQIIEHFHETPGFIGIVTGFAGLHGFTFTAWQSEEALRDGTQRGAHAVAMRAFHEGLAGAVFTSVWTPARLNRQWTRCPNGHTNDAAREDRSCETCGEALPALQPYL